MFSLIMEPGLLHLSSRVILFLWLFSVVQSGAEENALALWPEDLEGGPKSTTCWPCDTVLPNLSVPICKMGVTTPVLPVPMQVPLGSLAETE